MVKSIHAKVPSKNEMQILNLLLCIWTLSQRFKNSSSVPKSLDQNCWCWVAKLQAWKIFALVLSAPAKLPTTWGFLDQSQRLTVQRLAICFPNYQKILNIWLKTTNGNTPMVFSQERECCWCCPQCSGLFSSCSGNRCLIRLIIPPITKWLTKVHNKHTLG